MFGVQTGEIDVEKRCFMMTGIRSIILLAMGIIACQKRDDGTEEIATYITDGYVIYALAEIENTPLSNEEVITEILEGRSEQLREQLVLFREEEWPEPVSVWLKNAEGITEVFWGDYDEACRIFEETVDMLKVMISNSNPLGNFLKDGRIRTDFTDIVWTDFKSYTMSEAAYNFLSLD